MTQKNNLHNIQFKKKIYYKKIKGNIDTKKELKWVVLYNTTKSVISKKRLNSSHNIYTQYKRNMSYKYEKFAPQNLSKN